jgi:hypothetical protein
MTAIDLLDPWRVGRIPHALVVRGPARQITGQRDLRALPADRVDQDCVGHDLLLSGAILGPDHPDHLADRRAESPSVESQLRELAASRPAAPKAASRADRWSSGDAATVRWRRRC